MKKLALAAVTASMALGVAAPVSAAPTPKPTITLECSTRNYEGTLMSKDSLAVLIDDGTSVSVLKEVDGAFTTPGIEKNAQEEIECSWISPITNTTKTGRVSITPLGQP